ncbi:MAG TPA: endolytic transglycosylase MltG [Candidatus Limnocylindrales bacterium]
MTVRGGRGPRDQMVDPAPQPAPAEYGYRRSARYGRGPGDQRRYERYGDHRGGFLGLVRFLLFLAVLAAAVVLVLVTIARPILRMAVAPWAEQNPGSLSIGFIAELVREDLGTALTDPASTDNTTVAFVVADGDTPATLAPKLQDAGLIASQVAFLFLAREDNLAPQLTAGTFQLAKNMTPEQVVQGLIKNRVVEQSISITFREGLRIEQMTAKLETIQGTQIDPKAFYDLAEHPSDKLLGDYPWLLDPKIHTKGASLEGFLYPATYSVRTDAIAPTDAEGLIRMMLDAFYAKVGPTRMAQATAGGLTFQQALVMASIIEQEAQLDVDRPLIAGVYTNRLNPKMWPTGLLQSDPTIFYVNDTMQLDKLAFAKWQTYVFWSALPQGYQLPVPLPADIAGYNTYTSKGLPPGPICSPALPSIDAALNPNTKTGYLFFLATGQDGKTVYAKTQAQHDANVAKYLH